MKIQEVQNNLSFGMALDMNTAKVRRKCGKTMANAAEGAKDELQQLANGRYIRIRAGHFPFAGPDYDFFGIKASPYESWFQRLLHPFSRKRQILFFRHWVDVDCMQNRLVRDTKNFIEMF